MEPSAPSHRQAAMEKVAFVSSPGLPLISNFKVVGSHPLNRSFHRLEQLPRFAQQRLNLLALRDRVPSEQAMLARVLVSPWRAGFRRTAVHAAALLAAHCRRAARSAAADSCAATRARQHRTGIAGVIAQGRAPRFASMGLCSRAPGWASRPSPPAPGPCPKRALAQAA